MFKMFSHVYMRRFCIQSSITKVLSSFFPIDKVTSHICLLWPILMVFYIRLRVSCAEQQNISIELEWYIWEREAQALTYIDERSSHSATEKYRKKEKKTRETSHQSSLIPYSIVLFHACIYDQWLLVHLPRDILGRCEVIITFFASFSLIVRLQPIEINSLTRINFDSTWCDLFLIKDRQNFFSFQNHS